MRYRSLLALAILPALLFSGNLYSQFIELSGTGNQNLQSIHYKSDGVVWIGLDGQTLRSSDFGNTFLSLDSYDNTAGVDIFGTTDGIYCFSPTRAMMVGDFFLPNNAIIYETNSSGVIWDRIYSDNLQFMPERWTSDIAVGANGRIIVVGSQGRVIVSDNDGEIWTLTGADGTTQHLQYIEYLGQNIWLAKGENVLVRSTNNGTTWTALI